MPKAADLHPKSCYSSFQWNADSSSFRVTQPPRSMHQSRLEDTSGIYSSVFGQPSLQQIPQWEQPSLPHRPAGSRHHQRVDPRFTPAGIPPRVAPAQRPSAVEVQYWQGKPERSASLLASAEAMQPAKPSPSKEQDENGLPLRRLSRKPREIKTGLGRRRRTPNERREDALRKWEVIAERVGRDNSEVVADLDKCREEREAHDMI